MTFQRRIASPLPSQHSTCDVSTILHLWIKLYAIPERKTETLLKASRSFLGKLTFFKKVWHLLFYSVFIWWFRSYTAIIQRFKIHYVLEAWDLFALQDFEKLGQSTFCCFLYSLTSGSGRDRMNTRLSDYYFSSKVSEI